MRAAQNLGRFTHLPVDRSTAWSLDRDTDQAHSGGRLALDPGPMCAESRLFRR